MESVFGDSPQDALHPLATVVRPHECRCARRQTTRSPFKYKAQRQAARGSELGELGSDPVRFIKLSRLTPAATIWAFLNPPCHAPLPKTPLVTGQSAPLSVAWACSGNENLP